MASLKDVVFFNIRRRMGIMFLYRLGRLLSFNKPTVSVLCYHGFSEKNLYSVSAQVFKKQIEALSPYVDFISLDQVMEIVEGGKLHRSAVAITIDDGYSDLLSILPFTIEHNIPITLFALSDSLSVNRDELDNNEGLVSDDDLLMLYKKGWRIGSHSRTHANLSKLSGIDLKEEILGSKKRLEEVIGDKISYFSYPKGKYTKEVIRTVKEAGYKASFSVLPGGIENHRNRWTLPRTVINRYDNLAADPLTYVFGPQLIGRFLKLLGR